MKRSKHLSTTTMRGSPGGGGGIVRQSRGRGSVALRPFGRWWALDKPWTRQQPCALTHPPCCLGRVSRSRDAKVVIVPFIRSPVVQEERSAMANPEHLLMSKDMVKNNFPDCLSRSILAPE